jgi:hypothetical protein
MLAAQTAAVDKEDAGVLLRQPQAVRLQAVKCPLPPTAELAKCGDQGIEPASQHDGLIEDCYRLFHQAGGGSGDDFWQQQQGAVATPDNPVRLALLDDLNTPLAISRLTALYQQARGVKRTAKGRQEVRLKARRTP